MEEETAGGTPCSVRSVVRCTVAHTHSAGPADAGAGATPGSIKWSSEAVKQRRKGQETWGGFEKDVACR